MHNANRFAPRNIVDAARANALSRIPGDRRAPAVFREFASWPEVDEPLTTGIDRLREGMEGALGPARESVFSFLRYFDHAQWDSDRSSRSMYSEQRDWYLPLHVYWELTPSAVLFQLSRQPAYVGNQLSILETARYVADAIDCVGRLYRALGIEANVRAELTVTGGHDLRVDGATGACESRELRWSSSHVPDRWIGEREILAEQCMRELLAQCAGRIGLDGRIDRGLAAEFEHLNARRALHA